MFYQMGKVKDCTVKEIFDLIFWALTGKIKNSCNIERQLMQIIITPPQKYSKRESDSLSLMSPENKSLKTSHILYSVTHTSAWGPNSGGGGSGQV